MSRNNLQFIRIDLNIETDLAITKLIRKFGYEALGLYLHTLNIIYPLGAEIDKETLKEELADCSENGEAIFNLMLKTGLLKEDGDKVYSSRAKEEVKYFEDYIKAKSEAGKRGNEIRWGNRRAIADQSQCDNKAIADQSQDIANNRTLHNNTLHNNTNKSKKKADAFHAPTLEEVKAYCSEKGLVTDPVQFFNYFTEGNWTDANGNKVRNWKQKLLTWEKFNSASFRVEQPRNTRQLTITDRNEREEGIISRNADGSINI